VAVVLGASQGEIDARVWIGGVVKGGKIVVWEVGEGT
jgi:hypothetical protein